MFSILTDIYQVQRKIGYCPQFDALYDELTAREHLQLYSRLRGISPKHQNKVIFVGQCCMLSDNLHLRDRRTDRRRESNLVNFSLKLLHLVAIILVNFLTINWTKFRVFIGWSRILSSLKFLWSIAVRSPIGWTPLTDTIGQRDERTNGRMKGRVYSSVRPSVS